MKVLIVDDEQLVRWFLERAISKIGHAVSTAPNIHEAYTRLSAQDIDLLFVDLRMPDGNGTELIRKIDSLGKKPKIVVCSAYITSELEDELTGKGICILRKPFKLEELNQVLKNCNAL